MFECAVLGPRDEEHGGHGVGVVHSEDGHAVAVVAVE